MNREHSDVFLVPKNKGGNMDYFFIELGNILLYSFILTCGIFSIYFFLKSRKNISRDIEKHQKQGLKTHRIHRKKYGYLNDIEKTIHAH